MSLKYLKTMIVVFGVAVFATYLIASQPSRSQRYDQQTQCLVRMEKRTTQSGEKFQFVWNFENATPSFVSGVLSSPQVGTPKEVAFQFIQTNKALFRLIAPKDELVVTQIQKDHIGMNHVRFQQIYNGVLVWGSQIIVHLDKQGAVRIVNGRYYPTPDISVHFSLTERDAILKAQKDLGKTVEFWQHPSAELVIYIEQQRAFLTWKAELKSLSPPADWIYFIDANSGEIIHKYDNLQFDGPAIGSGVGLDNQIKPLNTYFYQNKYWLVDASKIMFTPPFSSLNGIIATYDAQNLPPTGGRYSIFLVSDPNGDNNFDDNESLKAAVDAHYYIGVVYDYFLNTFGRNSWDNRGSSITAVVHFEQNYNNSFWSGDGTIVFGDGDGVEFTPFSGALDVVAHEFTHGITQTSANLVYENQSGALNESYSDVFGAMVDDDDWTIGEDIYTPGIPGDAIRSLQAPSLYDQPDHMDDYRHLLPDPNYDNGGVHINCGIPNKACYNLASVIGRDKTQKIYYRTLTVYLTPLSQFVDAYYATLQACEDLYGNPSTEYTAVKNGFNAVGIDESTGGISEIQLSRDVAIDEYVGVQEYDMYYIDVPVSATSFTVSTTNTVDDVLDLFLTIDSYPTPVRYDFASATYSGNEIITVDNSTNPCIRAGRFYILVRAWTGGNYTITATYEVPEPSRPTVRIEPVLKEIRKNQTGTIEVFVDSVSNLGAFEFTITYDGQIVQIAQQDDVVLGSFLGSTDRTVFPVGPTIDNNTGVVKFGAFSFGNQTGASTDTGGKLATITWTAQDTGDVTTGLILSNVKLTDISGNIVPNVKTIDGNIHVTSCFWADVNCDGEVNIVDIQLIAAHWGAVVGDPDPNKPKYDPMYDLDNEGQGDGDIDIVDIQLAAWWWQKPFPDAVASVATQSIMSLPENCSIGIELTKLQEDGTYLAEILIENAFDLGAFQFDLVPANDRTRVETFELGDFWVQSSNKVVVLKSQPQAMGNRATFGAYSFGNNPGASGCGILAKVKITGEEPFMIRLENVQITDRRGKQIAVSNIASEISVPAIPRAFSLHQNYPNPFNLVTTIRYQLSKNSDITLKVYNLAGQLVRTLINRRQLAGDYFICWDGKDEKGQVVPSGIYLYKLEVEELSISKKMVLIH